LTQELLQGDGRATDQVARHAAAGADADLSVIALPGDEGTLQVDAAAGALADELPGVPIEMGTTHAGAVFTSGSARLIQDYGGTLGDFENAAMLGPVVVVPLQAGDRVIGTLSVARLANRPGFTSSDVDHLSLFAAHAGLAVELDRSRSAQELVRLLLDRERIAAELHDDVISELFAVGMGMQALTARMVPDHESHSRLLELVDSVDATIRRIRATVFSLGPEGEHPAPDRETG
jgi:signal transduction histidine kinase